MTTQFLSLSHGVRSQLEDCQRVAWFVWESFEREHLITWRALSSTLPAMGFGWAAAMQALALCFAPPRAAPAPTARFGHREGPWVPAAGRRPSSSRRSSRRPADFTRQDPKSAPKAVTG